MYKYKIITNYGKVLYKSDPYGICRQAS
ncbi:hypothetical protein [Clostridium estertheticum]